MQPLQICIGPSIRIGREIQCLPYAVFFLFIKKNHGQYGRSLSVEGCYQRGMPRLVFFYILKIQNMCYHYQNKYMRKKYFF